MAGFRKGCSDSLPWLLSLLFQRCRTRHFPSGGDGFQRVLRFSFFTDAEPFLSSLLSIYVDLLDGVSVFFSNSAPEVRWLISSSFGGWE